MVARSNGCRTRPLVLVLVSVLAARAAAAPTDAGPSAIQSSRAPAVLVVFPFGSPDGGRAGEVFADRMRLRARRLGLVVVDALSTRDAMSGAAMPTLTTPTDTVAVLLKERFAADLGLWGEVRPLGNGTEVVACGADVRGKEIRSLSEIRRADQPQFFASVQDKILESLSGLAKVPVAVADPESDAKVPTRGPNLVPNGGFEEGPDDHPTGWERTDGLTTFRVSGLSPTGRCMTFDTDVYHAQWVAWRRRWRQGARPEDAPPKTPTSGAKYNTVAGIYGVEYVSDPIPVVPGKAYKIEVDYRAKTSDFFFPKMFVRGYGDIRGEKRVVYDAYLALRSIGNTDQWKHNVRIITIPTDTQAAVEFVRVKLYAYWPPGVYAFDNVGLREAVLPSVPAKPN